MSSAQAFGLSLFRIGCLCRHERCAVRFFPYDRLDMITHIFGGVARKGGNF